MDGTANARASVTENMLADRNQKQRFAIIVDTPSFCFAGTDYATEGLRREEARDAREKLNFVARGRQVSLQIQNLPFHVTALACRIIVNIPLR
jgi:hypothetical protein